jgi:hypothetical protein
VAQRMIEQHEEFIATVDVWTLRHLRWPFMRVFARSFVERQELCRYEQGLLSSGQWSMVRCSPHLESGASRAPHLYDFYGVRQA